ncbi:MAG: GNAT family N-acetyltransferase [Pseudomonadota bacterium]
MNLATALAADVTFRVASARSQDVQALIAESAPAQQKALGKTAGNGGVPFDLAAPNTVVLVAREASGRLAGYVALVDMLHYGEIRFLFVRPKDRRRGIGWQLMIELEDQARMIGLRELCVSDPSDGARSGFWSALGYRSAVPGKTASAAISNTVLLKSL